MNAEMKRDVFEATLVRIGTRRASDALDALASRLAARGIVVETCLELTEGGEVTLYVVRPGSPSVQAEERLWIGATTAEFSRLADEIGEQLISGIKARKHARVGARREAKG